MYWPVRVGFFGSFVVLATLGMGSTPGHAACVLAGGTVTCTGLDDDGFIGGNNLTVTVDTGAFVQSIYDGNPDTLCPVFRSALRLGQNARVTNRGQMLGRGTCGLGIEALSGLTLTNEGTIITDAEVGFAVLAGDGFNVTNSGTLRTVSAGSTAFVGASNGRFTNTTTGVIETTGADSPGVFVENTNTVINDGRITTVNAGSFGIDVGAGNTVTNTGTITTSGIASDGILLRGGGNTVTNRGVITALPTLTPRRGEESVGINGGFGFFNTIVNSGTINGDYAGVSMFAGSLTNQGTINGNYAGVVLDGGTLTNNGTIGGAVMIGAGAATVINTGTIRGNGTLAINVTLVASPTIINSGRIDGNIQMGAVGGSITLGTGSIINGNISGAFKSGSDLNLTGSGTLSSPMSNIATLSQITDGAWVLGQRYGFQSVILQAGTLTLTDGMRVGSTLVVQSKSRLAGVGPIQQLGTAGGNLSLSGVLAPGLNAVAGSVFSLQGRATLNSGSRIELDIAAGANDRVDVAGTIASGATIALNYAGAPVRDGQTFTILTASNITTLNSQPCTALVQEGTPIGRDCFAITDSSPFFIRSSATVTATRVIARAQRQAYATAASTPQEARVAVGLDRAVAAGASISSLLSTLDASTQSEASATFAALTTDAPAAAQTWGILAGGSVASAISPWLEIAPSDSPRGQWRTWGSIFARTGESGPKTDSANFDYDMQGVIAAADYAVIDGTRLGVAASRVEGETFFAAGAAKTNLSMTSFGVYLSQAWQKWRAGAGLTTSDGHANANRFQTLATQTTALTSRTDTGGESAFVQTSYALGTEMFLVKPTASLTYVRAKIGSTDERVATGLTIMRETASSLRGDVGVRAIAKPGPVHFIAAVFWSQNFKDNDRTARARLSGLPGSDFTIIGKAEKRGWLNTQAGVNIEVMPGIMARLGWSGILNDRLGGHTASAGLSYRW